MQTLAALGLLALVAAVAGLIAQWVVLRLFRHMRDTLKANWAGILLHDNVLRRLARSCPR